MPGMVGPGPSMRSVRRPQTYEGHRHRDVTGGGPRGGGLRRERRPGHQRLADPRRRRRPPDGTFVRLAGLAGLIAGAFSMAAGEYVSMQAQRELIERELEVERQSLAEAPEMEREELADASTTERGIASGGGAGPGRQRHEGSRPGARHPRPRRARDQPAVDRVADPGRGLLVPRLLGGRPAAAHPLARHRRRRGGGGLDRDRRSWPRRSWAGRSGSSPAAPRGGQPSGRSWSS